MRLVNPPGEGSELSRSPLLRYGCAVAGVGVATWVRLLLDPLLGNQIPYPTLLFAVLLAAWYGGVWPALLAVVLGIFSADYFLVLPRGSFGLTGAEQYIDLALYLAVGVGIAVLGGAMQSESLRTIRKLQKAQDALAQAEERLRLTQLLEGPLMPPRERFSRVLQTDPEVIEKARRVVPEPTQPRLF